MPSDTQVFFAMRVFVEGASSTSPTSKSSGWGCVLGDKNMAAALIDRTVHHGRLIRFEGRSYCNQHALMTR